MKKFTPIMPGVYDDGEGGMHIDVAELLAAHGYPNTRTNRAMIAEAARDLIARQYPQTTVIITKEE